METMAGPAIAEIDADLLTMSSRQLVFRYIDEIFSDYAERLASLPEVVDEIKTIVDTLLQHPSS